MGYCDLATLPPVATDGDTPLRWYECARQVWSAPRPNDGACGTHIRRCSPRIAQDVTLLPEDWPRAAVSAAVGAASGSRHRLTATTGHLIHAQWPQVDPHTTAPCAGSRSSLASRAACESAPPEPRYSARVSAALPGSGGGIRHNGQPCEGSFCWREPRRKQLFLQV